MSLPETLHFERLRGHLTTECFYRKISLRCPRKDEWYVSGAIPMAYRASRDLSTRYLIVEPTHIAKRVTRTERGEALNVGA